MGHLERDIIVKQILKTHYCYCTDMGKLWTKLEKELKKVKKDEKPA